MKEVMVGHAQTEESEAQPASVGIVLIHMEVSFGDVDQASVALRVDDKWICGVWCAGTCVEMFVDRWMCDER